MYYFTVSSLPYLTYEGEPPISIDQFIEACRTFLSPGDFDLVLHASLSPGGEDRPDGTKPLAQWRKWDAAVRNELVKLRASGPGLAPEEFLRALEFIPEAFDIAREAFSQGSPADAEDALSRARWNFLDRLEVGHYFDIDKLIIYHIRLQLLERKARMTEVKGKEEYNRSYEAVRQDFSG